MLYIYLYRDMQWAVNIFCENTRGKIHSNTKIRYFNDKTVIDSRVVATCFYKKYCLISFFKLAGSIFKPNAALAVCLIGILLKDSLYANIYSAKANRIDIALGWWLFHYWILVNVRLLLERKLLLNLKLRSLRD